MRVFAYYLPQFHPIPENDNWWGKGFTEWTNVGRAKPLFRNHYQPHVPSDLGYYDLRLPEIRESQAELAKLAGIEGFIYWHYWFAGKRLLERPFLEVLNSGKPDFPFCLAWANESWTGVWNNDHKRLLIEQTYPGKDDYFNHFYANLNAFLDKRYLKIDDRCVFIIYKPFNLPNPGEFFSIWNELADKHRLNKFYFIAVSNKCSTEISQIMDMGFDAINSNNLLDSTNSISKINTLYKGISRKYLGGKLTLSKFRYSDVINNWIKSEDYNENVIPSILPNWDTSPRSGRRAIIVYDSTPDLFDEHLCALKDVIKSKNNKILFLKSWNEWAEGNYVEPDLKYGSGYLNVLRNHLQNTGRIK